MKLWILTLAFVTFAEARLFEVKEDNTTCLLLQLNGSVILTSSVAGEEPVRLSFENASVITNSSNCTVIRLNLTETVEVWFEFSDEGKEWSVTPYAQLNQSAFFNETFNGTITYRGLPLEDTFNKAESYQCNANSTLKFNSTEVHNISVEAAVSNFTIQSVNTSSFVPGKHCKEDTSTTVAPTTATTTPTTLAPSTTPKPSLEQNFSCSYNATTKFRLIGIFTLSITYNATVAGKNQSKTVTVDVPKVPASETNCSSESNESLTFKFFDNWSIEYIFQSKGGNKYYVSNITITYVHDEHLPNSTNPNTTATVRFSKPDYLEASTSGYYTCHARTSLAIDEVTLITEGFKYKAFNDKGDITFSTGEITECSNDEQTSSVVPIAVGAALAGLVVIVLIAYLIGRRRSRKAGYESV